MAQTPRPVDAGIAVGQVFLGKYRVEAILGQGGMGVVAKCVHLGLNEFFAIKMLRQDVLLDRDATERFTREAQAASKLKSEHVARVIDVGESEAGVPYMVMEFLDGEDLGQMVDERGALQAPFASMLMLQACEALCEAHTNNIVHRDVKPSNLFVTWRPDGSALVKVLDFGISKSPVGTDMKLTQTQSLLGTPAYMSPEQMRSARLVDMRTDIWSLGTVFYELLEGRRPFEAESFSEMCVKVAVDAPAPMQKAPPALQAIILRCLAKSPDQRYANMGELARDLLPHVQDVHQAALLVDRMQRMLGRRSAASGDQWDASTGSGVVGRIPHAVRDIGSAPIAVFNPTTDPFGAPTPTPAPWSGETRAPTVTLREDSRPVHAIGDEPSQRKRSKLPWIIAAVLIAGGLGTAAALGMFSSADTKVAAVQQPPDDGSANAPANKPDDKGEPKVGGTPEPKLAVEPKVVEPAPVIDAPKLGQEDEQLVKGLEDLATAAKTQKPCAAWTDELHKLGKNGVKSVTDAIAAFDEPKRKLFDATYKVQVEIAIKTITAYAQTCVRRGNAGTPRPVVCSSGYHKVGTGCVKDVAVVKDPPPISCPAGHHKVGNSCAKDEAEPTKPGGTRSPNGKCGIVDRLPSGDWPERCK